MSWHTYAEADSGLVKLVVMTNDFFNNQQHEIKTRQFICVKQIKSSFFSNNGNQNQITWKPAFTEN